MRRLRRMCCSTSRTDSQDVENRQYSNDNSVTRVGKRITRAHKYEKNLKPAERIVWVTVDDHLAARIHGDLAKHGIARFRSHLHGE